jgi:hypothetical protein
MWMHELHLQGLLRSGKIEKIQINKTISFIIVSFILIILIIVSFIILILIRLELAFCGLSCFDLGLFSVIVEA